MNLTYVELFAGAGGMSLGLEMAGWRCVAHAEIEPHARAVLRHHWPDVPLYGDVSQLDGRQFKGVTMLTGGSPCQDLSIAGKRAGMADGTRSSLFFEQVRIWNEMEAPFILWENVYGAFSSHAGRDFAAVLTAIVGADVPVPAKRWKRAGYVVGPAGVAAWRTLDAQYFGVPQRRRRVFVLGSRDPRVDPAQVLSLLESLSGHSASSGKARQSSSAYSGAGASGAVGVLGDISHALMANGYGASEDGTGRGTPVVVTDSRVAPSKANRAQGFSLSDSESNCLTPWDAQAKRVYGTNGLMGTLPAAENSGQQQMSVFPTGFSTTGSVGYVHDIMPTLPHKTGLGCSGAQMMGVITYSGNDIMPSIPASYSQGIGHNKDQLIVAVDVYNQTINTDGIAHTIRAHNAGEGIPHTISFDNRPHISTDGVTETLTTEGTRNPMSVVMRQREGKPGGGKGPLLSAERQRTLGTSNDQVVFGTLQATDATKWGSNQWVEEGKVHLEAGVPRRLTPIECERLMGWPDLHTATGVNEKGKTYELADTARYKLCGNGIASPVTAWIGFQLRAAVESL